MNRQEEALKAFVGVRRTNEKLNQLDRLATQAYSLNLNEFAVLELLLHKGDTPIQQIKEKILIASSSTTYIIDQLVKKGLVERIPCSNDRRVTYASLTLEGRTVIEEAFPIHASYIEETFSVLSDEELANFREYLKRISRQSETIDVKTADDESMD
ncbi:MarR family transcriptional regulator [Aerococcaceae bacterium DSM 111020]|nr:MarR family transcriptional regulator [Aerococcaceae bacterium DSM 111020]